MPTKIKYQYSPLLYDVMFKYIFGNEKNIHFTEYLLAALFNKEDGYFKDKVTVTNSFLFSKTRKNERGLEADIKIKLQDGTLINLEAYTEFTFIEKAKSLMYLSHTYSTQLNKGEKIENVRPCLQFNFVQKIKYPYKEYSLKSEKNSEEYLNGMFKIQVIDVVKYGKIYYNGCEKLRGICRLINARDETELKEVVDSEGKEILKEMSEEMQKFYQDKWREEYFNNFNLYDSKHAVELKKIAKKSKRDAKIETARNLLALNIDVNDIVKATGLSLKTVLSLK